MSKFSIYLKQLLNKNNESIASVSRSIHAERTSIHRALNDERVLPYPVVQALATYFQLSLDERREFFRFYDMLVQGEDVWRNRTAICELLSNLSAVQFSSILQKEQPVISQSTDICNEEFVEGEYSVRNMIYSILSMEADRDAEVCFQMFLPPETSLVKTFQTLWQEGRHFQINQLFCFPTIVDGDCSKSVLILQQIIPLAFIARDSYHPYYFYEHPGALSVNPLNYYIITPHYLILVSQDLSKACLLQSKRMIKYYDDCFHDLKSHCEPLASYSTTLFEVLSFCADMIHLNDSLYLMPQPCFGRYYTPEIIAKYFRGDAGFTEEMYHSVLEYFSNLRANENKFYTIFSEEGLQYFAETGIITELPQEYVIPIDREDRYLFLSKLRDDIAAKKIIGRIAHPSSLRIPDYLTLYTDTAGNVWFDTTADFIYGAYYCDIHISEKSISHAFQNFMQSLIGSHLVYSQEETLQILDKYITRLYLP